MVEPGQTGNSHTALLVVEAHANYMSAYIPAYSISTIGGRISLDTHRFYKGMDLPMSRVGSAMQMKAIKQAAGTGRGALAENKSVCMASLCRVPGAESRSVTG